MAYQDPLALQLDATSQADSASVLAGSSDFTQTELPIEPPLPPVVLSASDGSIMGAPDFSAPLSFEPFGIVINSLGHIRSGQSKYNTGAGWWIGNDNNVSKLSIGNPASRSLAWDGTNLTINGYVQTGIGAFGGDGSDGALSVPSGTTTINLGGLTNVTKNYSSIIIAAGATLAFSNPHTNGTVVILKSQGLIQIAGTVNMQGAGAPGGAAVQQSFAASTGHTDGNAGNNGNIYSLFLSNTNAGGAGNGFSVPGNGGALPTIALNTAYYTNIFNYAFKYTNLWTAAAGGSGEVRGISTNGDYTSGAGGRASGTVLIECAGAWNFTGTINASGGNGGDAVINSNGTQIGAGGGGGGAAGLIFVLYNTLTSNSGTYSVAGGVGGIGLGGTSVGTGAGGGGGANLINVGSAGSAIGGSNFNAKTGGDGAIGIAFVAQNNLYA